MGYPAYGMPNFNQNPYGGNMGYPGSPGGVVNNYYGAPPTTGASGPSGPSGAAPDMWNTFGNMAMSLPGYFLSNNQANNGYNAAVGASAYNPTGINGPYGSVGSNGAGGYNLDPGAALSPFGNLATASGNYANGQFAGPNQYDTAAGGVMNAFSNFNPTDFANQDYARLSAMAAPGVTNQIQGMENFEQKSGRNGLTQNGQLGDVGGLDLSLRTADAGLRQQAVTDARTEGGYLANLATTFANQGNTQRTNAMGNATSGLGNTLAINSSLQQLLQDSISNSSNRAAAGYNQGQFSVGKGNSQASATGNLFGGFNQAMQPFGGPGGLLKQGYNWMTGGNDPNGGLTQDQMDTINNTDFNTYQPSWASNNPGDPGTYQPSGDGSVPT